MKSYIFAFSSAAQAFKFMANNSTLIHWVCSHNTNEAYYVMATAKENPETQLDAAIAEILKEIHGKTKVNQVSAGCVFKCII